LADEWVLTLRFRDEKEPPGGGLAKKEPPGGGLESQNREASNRVDRSHSTSRKLDIFVIDCKT
jgi:hypothetical protein